MWHWDVGRSSNTRCATLLPDVHLHAISIMSYHIIMPGYESALLPSCPACFMAVWTCGGVTRGYAPTQATHTAAQCVVTLPRHNHMAAALSVWVGHHAPTPSLPHCLLCWDMVGPVEGGPRSRVCVRHYLYLPARMSLFLLLNCQCM